MSADPPAEIGNVIVVGNKFMSVDMYKHIDRLYKIFQS